MRVNSYRLSTVPDACLPIKPLDSLLIHLMRHSSIVTTVRFYVSTTSIPLPRSSTELSERPSDRRPSDDEKAAKTAVNSAAGVSMVSPEVASSLVFTAFAASHGVTMMSSWTFSVAPPAEKRKKASEQDCSEAYFSGGSRLFAARRRRPYRNRF